MADGSAIEWTDATWNPVTGCTKITAGCDNCYAARFSERWRGVPGHPFENGFDLTLRPERIGQPLAWKRSRMIFVNSMSDLFHKEMPLEFIQRVFKVMNECPHLIFQVLTKRGDRLQQEWPHLTWSGNIWMGVSVENEAVTHRIESLRKVPAAVRFLSCEPLIRPLSGLNLKGIDWVIVGGESGVHPRPMKAEWVVQIRDQCQKHDVAFFFKQWGGRNKKAAGRELEGVHHDTFPKPKRRRQVKSV